MRVLCSLFAVGLLLSACGTDADIGVHGLNASQEAVVSGAGYTTFDSTAQGCLDSPNGINCNHYSAKNKVYASGGPVSNGLSDGAYYFSVLVPGFQNSGFVDGAIGNLSDTVANVTVGDLGHGDTAADRTFTVLNHVISYTGPHGVGTSSNGKFIIQLTPFDNTSNDGGVYILALCAVGATKPKDCKYDAFHAPNDDDVVVVIESVDGYVGGMKYYDANANGQLDQGEVGIPNWRIHLVDGVEDVLTTDVNGEFGVSLIADTYHFNEVLPLAPTTWLQTGNLVDQTVVDGAAVVTLNADKTYTIEVNDDSNTLNVLFGNLCVGAGGGLTLGFWSNKNGQALVGADDLALLSSLNLRNAQGANFDPATYALFRPWLLGATATNMAYMLSAQLAAMELNVLNGKVSGASLVLAPGTLSANANGFASVTALMNEANLALGANGTVLSLSPVRGYQEALKNALDNANNDRTFVRPSAAACPVPTFAQ